MRISHKALWLGFTCCNSVVLDIFQHKGGKPSPQITHMLFDFKVQSSVLLYQLIITKIGQHENNKSTNLDLISASSHVPEWVEYGTPNKQQVFKTVFKASNLSMSFKTICQSGCLTLQKSPGPGCSKLTMSLVNVSLKFQTLISEICQYFLLKKCEKLLQ